MYGKYTSTAQTVRDGESAEVAIDVNRRLITSGGAGIAGSPSGGVQSVQGVSGGTPVPVTSAPTSSAALTTVNSSATNVTLLAANANRRGVILYNSDANALLLKFGAVASASSFTYRIPTATTWEMSQPAYTGQIDGIWEVDGAGAALITELT